jgi:drug/metabolite transporter (DMT)-like permease
MLLASATAMLLPLEFVPSLLRRFSLGHEPAPADWPQAIACLAVLGIVGTGIAIWLFTRLIIERGPLFAGMVTYVLPVLALAWGAADGEPITAFQIGAMAGVLAMVALVQFGAGRPAAWNREESALPGGQADC